MTALPAPRTFTCPAATGEIHDHGAHVSAWTPAGHQPVLWMSEASVFETGAPIRGGVPICWPWFGAGRTKDMQPAHGFARLVGWHLRDVVEADDATTVTYTLTNADATDERFGFPYEATYEATLGAELRLKLTITNTGTEEFAYEEALHTYLAVGDATQVRIQGLDGSEYLDKAPGGSSDPVTQAGDVTITTETDRVYHSTSDVTVVDPALGRSLRIRKGGSANTVVWNPGVAKAAAMPDFGDDEWRGMLCIEAANAMDDAIVLAPGQSHTMSYTLSVVAT